MEINGDAFEMDKAALMHYKENLIFILKKNTTMHEKLSYLQSFEDLGVMKLGCIDSNDHNYRRFIDKLEECGIRFIEQRVPLDDSPYDSVSILYDLNDLEIIEEIRMEAYKRSGNYRFTIEAGEAETRIADSELIRDKAVMIIENLNFFEKTLLKLKCEDISPAFNFHEEERCSDDGEVSFSVLFRDAKVMDPEGNNDLCRAYLNTMISLYGYNGEHIMDHIIADMDVEAAIDLGADTGETLYIAGANEGRIKHYIEINRNGFGMYVSTIKDGKRSDAMMEPIEKYSSNREDPDYEAKLLLALKEIPSKTVILTAKELNEHLISAERNIESAQPMVHADERVIAQREKALVEIIDEVIRENMAASCQYDFLKSGQDKFGYYINEAGTILKACIDKTIPDGYEPDVILSINAILDQAGMDAGGYENALEALYSHNVYSHEAGISRNIDDHEKHIVAGKEER